MLRNLLKLTKRCIRKYQFLAIIITIWICFALGMWLYMQREMRITKKHETSFEPIKILWWTTNVPANYHETRYCDAYKCTFTSERKFLPESKAVLFYASSMDIGDLPLPRKRSQLWALMHEESPRNVPFIPHDSMLQHFNFTATFSRYSDFPLTLQYMPRLEQLTDTTYMLPIGQKTLLRQAGQLSSIVFLQSDCDTMSGREEYVRQLMQYISIDSYGSCLHNRDLPTSLTVDYLNKLYSPELLRFLGRYKFVLAYENGVCDDYITEKFWRPLIVGSIPIYFGSPSIRDWEPHNKSVIHISDFKSPNALADFVKSLDSNDTEYNTYLRHKYDMISPITNKRLENKEYDNSYDMFQYVECSICRKAYELLPHQTRVSSLAHYNCALPLVYPEMERSETNKNANSENNFNDNRKSWEWIIATGKCQAHVLNVLLQRNQNYTRLEFDTMLNRAFEANECN